MNVGYVPGLFKLQDLVKVPPTMRTDMYIRQAAPGTYRQVLREIRQKEIFKLIVDTNPRHMYHFFRAVSNDSFPRSLI
jgi:ionotropic kainate glutamate receptor 2